MTNRKLALQWVLRLLCLGCGGLQVQSGAAPIADEATVYGGKRAITAAPAPK